VAGPQRFDERPVISNEGQGGEQGDDILVTRRMVPLCLPDGVSVMPENRLIDGTSTGLSRF